MSGVAWVLAAGLLAGAAAVAAWPAGAVLRRLNGRRQGVSAVSFRRLWSQVQALADGSPRRAVGIAVAAGAVAGTTVGGPVAGLVLAVYGALGARAAVRRAARRRGVAARFRSLDGLNALAADLRAGLAVGAMPLAASPASSRDSDHRLAELTAAVLRLAERTGAPAADLVERIEADARAGDRSRATAAAQAAGAQATALLLAGLPVGGIALGYGIGVDPLEVLLGTPMGAACAIGAVLLQCAGLLWADRLSNGPTR
ncbi:type II secretion system F family protein [Actinoplanes sp. CA-051413]|uniref:type II secretion system F family protein n=1 Tax=Actinoplanes sp. CA-051413 TaxID=3239899 RepID=UPI003D95CFD4